MITWTEFSDQCESLLHSKSFLYLFFKFVDTFCFSLFLSFFCDSVGGSFVWYLFSSFLRLTVLKVVPVPLDLTSSEL